jgi:hypothetical protein
MCTCDDDKTAIETATQGFSERAFREQYEKTQRVLKAYATQHPVCAPALLL